MQSVNQETVITSGSGGHHVQLSPVSGPIGVVRQKMGVVTFSDGSSASLIESSHGGFLLRVRGGGETSWFVVDGVDRR